MNNQATLSSISNIKYWGNNYFNINKKGNISICPNPKFPDLVIDLNEIAQNIKFENKKYPILFNFPQIVQHRLSSINKAFNDAIKEFGYKNSYFLVYPIKVNQHKRIIDAILNANESVGLEAGSKAELMAVLDVNIITQSVIICNGYKDREYIKLALIGTKLGHKIFLVIEKISELSIILEESEKLKVLPNLGVRVKLASEGSGKWQSSGGDKSKFGLLANQILQVVNILSQKNILNCLQLLHFHLGSQIANIRDIANGAKESARFYAQLYKLGVNIQYFDVGGGLGIDYEGTRSHSDCSVNYGLNEYANNIVWSIGDVCKENNIPNPVIITESGRALTTHHSVFVANVIGIERFDELYDIVKPSVIDPRPLQSLWQVWEEINDVNCKKSLREQLHDSQYDLNEVHLLFTIGTINLNQRALAEKIYLNICKFIETNLDIGTRSNRVIIDEIEEKMADKFYLNFSLFQSMPDAWAVDQLFPVLPLNGLNKEVSRRIVLLDITCDSDGIIESYIDSEDVTKTMPMFDYDINNPPLFGFFLVGSYQEILGNMHNLFGKTPSIDVLISDDGKVILKNYSEGNNVAQMLEYVNLSADKFMKNYENQIIKSDLEDSVKHDFLKFLSNTLKGNTYLE